MNSKNFQALFRHALDAIVIIDENGRVINSNPSASKLFKRPRKKILLSKLSGIVLGSLDKRRGEVEIEANGKTLEYTKASIPDTQYKMFFFRDVTEAKLEMMRREHFLGIAGHELKNPLAVIKAINHMLLRKESVKKDSDMSLQIQKIDSKATVLTDLIGDLLDITKIKHRKLELTMEKVNIKEFVDDLIEDFSKVNHTHKIIINKIKPQTLYLDKTRIGQVVNNLLRNAAKYSPGQDLIIVNVKQDRRKIIFEVRDFGIGIPQDQIKKVFNLYYRIPGREKSFEGLGVGLYISHEIIAAHGGKLSVKSTVEEGTKFTFTLPLYNDKKRKKHTYS